MTGEQPSSANGWADADLARHAQRIQERIAASAARAGRDPASVALVAVTKTVVIERMLAAAALGLTRFGENRVQEALDKSERLRALSQRDPSVADLLSRVQWELIGHLQSNKAARALERFNRVQSVDTLRLAESLSARAANREGPLPILMEVNIGGEESKSGFAPAEVESAARALSALPGLRMEGLMTVAPLVSNPEQARPVFRALRDMRDQLRSAIPLDGDRWRELSMGMSDDFEVAIEEGATIIRVGRGLFGARPPIPRSAETTPESQ